MSRNAVIAGSVVLLHVAGIWALQSGLMRKAVELVVPAARAEPAGPGSRA